jgi:Bacterial SH3 domain
MNASIFKTLWRALAALCLAAVALGAQAQALQVSTDTELRAAPALDARVLAKLASGTDAQRIEVKGGWMRVKVATQEGWVRLTHVKSVTAGGRTPAPAQASNPITGLTGAFSASSNTATPTTGTRGLTPEQLANAQPDPKEVELLERFASTTAQAEQHARAGRLAAQKFDAYTEGEK